MRRANGQADLVDMLRGGLRCQDVTRGIFRASKVAVAAAVAGNDVEAQADGTADCFAGVGPKVGVRSRSAGR